nr:unnamed protein product [Callosobruchus analis]
MGVLWRKRSVLLKLAVILGTAWLTLAFLFYAETSELPRPPLVRTHSEVGVPQRLVMQEREVQAVQQMGPENPFKEAEVWTPPPKRPARKNVDIDAPAVLVPPQDLAGDMGKPVILPTNLTGIISIYLIKLEDHSALIR